MYIKEELKTKSTQKELAFELIQDMLRAISDPENPYASIAKYLQEFSKASSIAIYRFDKNKAVELDYISPSPNIQANNLSVLLNILKYNCKKNEISLFNTESSSKHFDESLSKLEVSNIYTVPLWIGNSNIGCIQIIDIPTPYDANLIEDTLSSIKNILALMLRNVFLYGQQQKQLKTSKANLEVLFNNREESIWSIDCKFNFLSFNNFFKQEYFKAYNQILKIGDSALANLPENVFQIWNHKYAEALKGKRFNFEFEETISGAYSCFDVNLSPIIIDEEIVGISAISINITKRKIAEKKLMESENKYRLLADHTFDWEYWLDPEGNYKYVSPSCEKISGYSPKEFYENPKLMLTLVHQDYQQLIKDQYAVPRTEVDSIEYKIITKTGIEKHIAHSCISIYDENGKYLGIRGVNRDVSEKKKAQYEKQYFNQIFEGSLNEIFIFDANNLHFIQANQSALNNLGYTSDELTKLRAIDIKPDISEDEFMLLIEPLKKDTQKKVVFDTVHQRKDKSTYPVEVHLQKAELNEKEVYVAIMLDTSDEMAAQEQFQKLSSAINQASVVVMITDADGMIEYVNPYFSKASGYGFEEVIGQNPRILKSGHTSPEQYTEIWTSIKAGKNWRGEFLNKRKDGTLYWEDTTITPIKNHKGDIIHIVAIKEEITEKKEIINELIVAKEKAEESDRLKTEFLTNMSHEIRTPMNGIVGFSELLDDPDSEVKDQHKFVNVIQNSAYQLLKIIDDILEISRLETKQVRTIQSTVSVNAICNELYEVFQLKHNNQNLKFTLEMGLPDNLSKMNTDETKLKKILSNLIENAFKFTRSGEINFGYRLNKTEIEFFVRDTGIGIHSSAYKHIFNRFSQVEKEISQKAGGLGLGLSIAKENAELLGGNIIVESIKGEGATFILRIPFSSTINEDKSGRTVETKLASIQNKQTILIAEDEEVNFEYLKILLEEYGPNFIILHAWNGQEAVDLCHTHPEINLVFMDIKMPILNGFEATKQIKEFRPKLPILAQTAYSTPEEIAHALESGCNDFISKPLNKNKIFKFINEFSLKGI